MVHGGTYVGVVDRYERDAVVVVLHRDGRPVEEFAVPERRLPEAARSLDARLEVRVAGGRIVDLEHAPRAAD